MRCTPWDGAPRKSAQTRTSATVFACSRAMPLAVKIASVRAASCSDATVTPCAISARFRRKILVEPVADQSDDAGVLLREHEMIDVVQKVKLGGRFAGMFEEPDRLLGRRHRIV